MRRTLVLLAAVSVSTFFSCGAAPARFLDDGGGCGCSLEQAQAGTVTLRARSLGPEDDETYWASAVSFTHGGATGTVGRQLTNNDWELTFGNDSLTDADLFDVNTVTDDRSFIVDLGELPLRDAPATIDPLAYPAQHEVNSGLPDDDVRQRDHVRVVEGHVYWLRTNDSDTKGVTLVGVQKHVKNESVTLAWFRSTDPDRFVFEWPAAK